MPLRNDTLHRRLQPSGLPRRFQVALGLSALFVIALIVSAVNSDTRPSVPSVTDLKETAKQAAEIFHHPELPQLWNPFVVDAHEPVEQANSVRGDSKWYSTFNWLSPFSSSVTLNADRALLPPPIERTPIYTYYSSADVKNKDVVAVENELILQWRRAWWAQGFRPVVLGHAEAKKHPLYPRIENLGIKDDKMRRDLERWLAWSHMSGGIISNWLVFPMAAYDDPTLQALRKRDYEKLRRFRGLEQALLCGKKEDIDAALSIALNSEAISTAKNVMELVPKKSFDTVSKHDGVAFYDSATIASKYDVVAGEIINSERTGLTALGRLINSHLQLVWQNTFKDGIAILSPHSGHLCSLTDASIHIASRLGHCISSPMPRSCPPNKRSCHPCSAQSPIPITTPSSYANVSTIFTIGTAQHPFTYNTLHYMRDKLDVRFIRRNTTRDQWLTDTTLDLISEDVGGPQRLIRFKEAVASSRDAWRSLWLVGERESDEPLDLDWLFGFPLPQLPKDTERMRILELQVKQGREDEADLALERELLAQSRLVVGARSGDDKKAADMVSAWNMADHEAWLFVKAYGARRILERLQWEEEEKHFAGTEKTLGWFEKPQAGE